MILKVCLELFQIYSMIPDFSRYRSSDIGFSILFRYFYLVFVQDRGVLEKLPMVFGTFCNVFISSHVLIVFSKSRNSRFFF